MGSPRPLHLTELAATDLEGADGPTWFLSMELVHGETLRECIERRGRMTTAEALPVVKQLAAGLGAVHQAGVVHRDFKSGNIMPAEGGARAVVMDFGLSQIAQEATGTIPSLLPGTLLGTPDYMAPEQVRGIANPAADIYSLGVVMYELVTGKLPLSGMDGIRRRLKEDAPSPRLEAPDLAEHWEETIRRCLSRDPADRFSRAEDVAEALESGEVRVSAPASISSGLCTTAVTETKTRWFARESSSSAKQAVSPSAIRHRIADGGRYHAGTHAINVVRTTRIPSVPVYRNSVLIFPQVVSMIGVEPQ